MFRTTVAVSKSKKRNVEASFSGGNVSSDGGVLLLREVDRRRRVIVKDEHTEKGRNPRYVVTNLRGSAQKLYDQVYCGRGGMKNRIKEQLLDLFADRTSCHRWWPNQWRLLLSS